MPKTEFLRQEEVSDGINVIVDNRFVALLPMASKAQVSHLVTSANLAFKQAIDRVLRGDD